jgi:glycosyltransferase involved in cell wall biosynthesis
MPRLRRQLYDRLPAPLRQAAREGTRRLRLLTAGHSRRTAARSLRRLVSGTAGGPSPRPGREDRRTLFIVDERVPAHDVDAGSLTLFHYLRLLTAAGLRVVYRPDDGLAAEPYATGLRELGVEVLGGPLDIAEWFTLHGGTLDALLLARPNVAPRYLFHARRRTTAPILYLAHDLAHIREERRHLVSGDPGARSEARRLLEIETHIFRSVDIVLTFSGDEAPVISRLAPGTPVRVVTPAFRSAGPPREHPAPPLAERRGVLFLGSFDHLPNVDAAEVLVREVMPLVWQRLPDLAVQLVGGHVPDRVEALRQARVEVVGHAPDLGPHWARARASVSPLRFGAGVKGKIVASLEAGVPVVTTQVGNEGIGLVHGVDALIGETPSELAAHIVRLHDEPSLAEGLARNGWHVLLERYSDERILDDLLAALRSGAERRTRA